MRSAQDRAQLPEEHLRLGQAIADRAQAERRVRHRVRRASGGGLQGLVRADVERADRDRLAFHRERDFAVGLELLFLVGQALPVHEQELGAKEADALGAVFEHFGHVLRQLDVGEELDRDPVERRGRGFPEPLELFPLQLVLGLAQPVLGQHDRVRVDDQHALHAVHDQQVVLADHVARVMQADDRRNVQAAREDRGMRSDAADVGDERAERMLLEQEHVGRRQVVRHDDQLGFVLGEDRGHGARPSEQGLEHALGDLRDVGLALLEVRVVDRVELADQRFHLLDQRPLGIGVPLADQCLRHLGQRRVVEDHRVQVDEGGELRRRIRGDLLADLDEFLAHLAHRSIEARDLGFDFGLRDFVVRDFHPGAGHQVRVPDGDPGRDAVAVQDEVHGAAPRATRLRRTCSRSAPAAP